MRLCRQCDQEKALEAFKGRSNKCLVCVKANRRKREFLGRDCEICGALFNPDKETECSNTRNHAQLLHFREVAARLRRDSRAYQAEDDMANPASDVTDV